MADPSVTIARRRFEPLIRKVLHFYWRFARGMTLGVRAVVLDDKGRVFLVRHSYVAGWHLPGGGVEVGETLVEALRRELLEEGNIVLDGAEVLHGVFFNRRVSRRDHVAVYLVREFHQTSAPMPNREIAECGFFPVDALPEEATRATGLRVREVMEGTVPPQDWS